MQVKLSSAKWRTFYRGGGGGGGGVKSATININVVVVTESNVTDKHSNT